MNTAPNDFVSQEPREFHFRIGRVSSSSLSGMIAGVVIASAFWLTGIWYASQLQTLACSPPAVNTALRQNAPAIQAQH